MPEWSANERGVVEIYESVRAGPTIALKRDQGGLRGVVELEGTHDWAVCAGMKRGSGRRARPELPSARHGQGGRLPWPQ